MRDAAGAVRSILSSARTRYLREIHGAGRATRAGTHGIHPVALALRVPPPERFVWQYIYSTPMAGALSKLDVQWRAALECDVCAKWRDHCDDGALVLNVGMTTAIAKK